MEFIAAKAIRVGEFGGSDQGPIGLRGRKSMAGESARLLVGLRSKQMAYCASAFLGGAGEKAIV